MARPRSELHGVLVVDKAPGLTSHDVVGLARRALQTREIGHTGTLDPMATGVLVLAIGEATKLVSHLTALHKVYETTLRLGQATDSLDADGSVVAEAPVPSLTRERVEQALTPFLGVTMQRAPVVSAIKVNGRPLYESARKGQAVEAPLREVRLDQAEVLAIELDAVTLRVRCGKGFYVRALGRDLAEALQTVGHLAALRRLENGSFTLVEAVDTAFLRSAAAGDEERRAALRERLVPLERVAAQLPNIVLSEEGVVHARHGRPIPLACIDRPSETTADVYAAFDQAGALVALVAASGEGLRVVRGIRRG